MSLTSLVGCTPEINSRLPKPAASNSIASETRDEPPVSTTMPSAVCAGSLSAPRNCDRNPTKPTAAPTNAAASTATRMPRSQAGAALVGFSVALAGIWSDGELMGCLAIFLQALH